MKKNFYLLILVLLINSGGGIYFEMYRNSLTIVLFLLFFVYLFINKKIYLLKTSIMLVIFFSIALFFIYQFAIGGQTINPYGYLILTLLIAFLANTTLDKKDFIVNFTKALNFYKYHAILSIFFFFIIKNYLVYFEFGNDRSYHTFYYIFFYLKGGAHEFYSITYVRNNGLFWEPGILQIFMNLLLFIQLFVVKSTKFQKLSTIFVIMTTFSTTGYIIMSLILVVKYFSKITFAKFIKTLPLVAISLFIFSPLLVYNIEEKASGEKKMSAQVRFFDAVQSIAIINDHPITGVGLTLEPYAKLQQQFYGTVFGMFSYNPEGNTNSVLNTIVFLGIPLGLFIIYALYRQNIFKKQRLLLFLILLLSLSSEPLLLRPFFMFIVFSGMLEIFSNTQKKYLKKGIINDIR